jgi:hypothetical protein
VKLGGIVPLAGLDGASGGNVAFPGRVGIQVLLDGAVGVIGGLVLGSSLQTFSHRSGKSHASCLALKSNPSGQVLTKGAQSLAFSGMHW